MNIMDNKRHWGCKQFFSRYYLGLKEPCKRFKLVNFSVLITQAVLDPCDCRVVRALRGDVRWMFHDMLVFL